MQLHTGIRVIIPASGRRTDAEKMVQDAGIKLFSYESIKGKRKNVIQKKKRKQKDSSGKADSFFAFWK